MKRLSAIISLKKSDSGKIGFGLMLLFLHSFGAKAVTLSSVSEPVSSSVYVGSSDVHLATLYFVQTGSGGSAPTLSSITITADDAGGGIDEMDHVTNIRAYHDDNAAASMNGTAFSANFQNFSSNSSGTATFGGESIGMPEYVHIYADISSSTSLSGNLKLSVSFAASVKGTGDPTAQATGLSFLDTKKYWIGTLDAACDGTFDDDDCWSTSKGTEVNTTAPTSLFSAYFDNNGGACSQCNDNCAVDADAAVKYLELTAYSGTLTINASRSVSLGATGFSQAAGTVTITGTLLNSGPFSHTGGTFSQSSGTVMLNSTSSRTITLASGTAFNDLYLNDGLIGYWNFDEASGNALDLSGYGNDGTLTNGPSRRTDSIPTLAFRNTASLDFDGTNDVVVTADIDGIDLATVLTVSCWVKPQELWEFQRVMVGKQSEGVSTDITFVLLSTSDEFMAIVHEDNSYGTDNASITTSAVNYSGDVRWYHVAFTFEAASATGLNIYVDGASAATAVSTANITALEATTVPVTFGDDNDGGDELNMLLDDVRIYSRVLSGAEITALAAGKKAGSGIATWTLGSNALDVNGDLKVISGTLDASGSNLGVELAGSWMFYDAAFTSRSGTVTLDGTAGAGQQFKSNTSVFNNLTFSGSGETWSLQDSLHVDGELTMTNGVLDLNDSNAVVAALSGSSNITLGSGDLEIDGSGTDTYSGVISETGGLIHSSSGTLTLSGNNTFDGAFDIEGGTVLVNGDQTSANGAATVSSGATLGGTGTIGGAVTVNSGGKITGATASTVGTLTLTSTLALNGEFRCNVTSNTVKDVVNVSGAVTGSGSVDGIMGYAPSADNTWGIIIGGASSSYSSITGNLTIDGGAAGSYFMTTSGNNLLLVYGSLTKHKLYWHGASSDFNASSNWTTDQGGTTEVSALVDGDTLLFSGSGANSDANATMTAIRSVASIDFSGYTGTFSNSTYNLTVSEGDVTFASGMTVTAGTGPLIFTAGSGAQVLTPKSGATHPSVSHTGAGTLQLSTNALICRGFSQSAGNLDLNGLNLTTNNGGNFTVTNGTTAALGELSGLTITVAGNASLTGQAGNLLDMNTASTCIFAVTGTLTATYADIGNNNASVSGGTANASTNSGGNSGWTFPYTDDYSQWPYYAEVTLNTTASGANVGSTVSDFPVLIRLTSSNFDFSEADANGADIRFEKASDGTHFPYHIERWVSGSSLAEIWVLVDQVAGNTSSAYMHMLWGNSAAVDSSDENSVFATANNFAAVWHIDDGAPYNDATSNGLNLTDGATAENTAAYIGEGRTFSNGDYLLSSHAGTLDFSGGADEFTMSAWINPDGVAILQGIFSKGGGTNDYDYYFAINASAGLYAEIDGTTLNSTGTIDATWHHVAFTWDHSTMKVYIDGSVDATTASHSTAIQDNDNDTYMGTRHTGGHDKFTGVMDELRIDDTDRGPNWIKLCYMNQRSDDKLVSISTTGLSSWRLNDIGPVSGAAISDASIYVGVGGTKDSLYKINLADGTKTWTQAFYTGASGDCGMPTYVYASSSYRLYFTAGNYLYARTDDGTTTSQIFAPQDLGAAAGTPYVNADATSVCVAYTNNLTCKNRTTGSDILGWPVSLNGISLTADLAVFNDELYYAQGDSVRKIDLDGTPQAGYYTGASTSQPLFAAGSVLYAFPAEDTIHAINTSDMSGKWKKRVNGTHTGPAFAMVEEGGVTTSLFVPMGTAVQSVSDDGASASIDWTYTAGANVQSGPIINSNAVYFGIDGGAYYAINATTGLILAGWPKSVASGNSDVGPWIENSTYNLVIFATDAGDLDAFALE